jgi:hypothetical protein
MKYTRVRTASSQAAERNNYIFFFFFVCMSDARRQNTVRLKEAGLKSPLQPEGGPPSRSSGGLFDLTQLAYVDFSCRFIKKIRIRRHELNDGAPYPLNRLLLFFEKCLVICGYFRG